MSWAGRIWRWCTSRTVRQARRLLRRVRRLSQAGADRLSTADVGDLQETMEAVAAALGDRADTLALRESTTRLAAAANRCLGRVIQSRPGEINETVLVATVVVVSFRLFFAQPMTIPTGSMQPTLYGVTVLDLRAREDQALPTGLRRLIERYVRGRSYYHIVAQTEGKLESVQPPEPAVPLPGFASFLQKQRFRVGSTWYTIWNPPQELPAVQGVEPHRLLFFHARVRPDHIYRPGEDIIKLAVVAGDRVWVDRVTYNFRRPRRGEIIVFRTQGIPGMHTDTHYLKRLVAMNGERVRIGNDRHLVVNGQRLDARTPGFERVYDFHGPPQEDVYSGHLNDTVARRYFNAPGLLAPLFPDAEAEFVVRPRHYLVMGDNTMSSLDGRRWGDFPEESVVGRARWRYWPLRR